MNAWSYPTLSFQKAYFFFSRILFHALHQKSNIINSCLDHISLYFVTSLWVQPIHDNITLWLLTTRTPCISLCQLVFYITKPCLTFILFLFILLFHKNKHAELPWKYTFKVNTMWGYTITVRHSLLLYINCSILLLFVNKLKAENHFYF